jgi:hypothetical protein
MKSFFKRIFDLKRIAQTFTVILFCSVLLGVLYEKGVSNWVIIIIMTVIMAPWAIYWALKDHDDTFGKK